VNRSKHTLIIRNVPEKLYVGLWNLRRKKNARSWRDLLEKIVEEWLEEESAWLWTSTNQP